MSSQALINFEENKKYGKQRCTAKIFGELIHKCLLNLSINVEFRRQSSKRQTTLVLAAIEVVFKSFLVLIRGCLSRVETAFDCF